MKIIEFFGTDFLIPDNVFTPYKDAEFITDLAIRFLRQSPSAFFCDIGTGSGVIAISILLRLQLARAIGVDISLDALAAARRNAWFWNVLPRLELRASDGLAALGDLRFDLILGNLPYWSKATLEKVSPSYRASQPPEAISDGSDTGLFLIAKIIDRAAEHLLPGGALLLEYGEPDTAKILDFFDLSIWENVLILNSGNKEPRAIFAVKGLA